METRQAYLIRFLRGIADVADRKQIGNIDELVSGGYISPNQGRVLVNGDLLREAADEFEKLLPKVVVTKDPTDELHFHLVRAENHAQQALNLLYKPDGPKRTIWFKMAIGRAQSILMSAYVRDVKRGRG